MAKAVGPTGQVFAVEANPHVRTRLERNLLITMRSTLRSFPMPLLTTRAHRTLLHPASKTFLSGDGHLTPDSTGSDALSVKVRRLDNVVSEAGLKRIDLIKIDVEDMSGPFFKERKPVLPNSNPALSSSTTPITQLVAVAAPNYCGSFFNSKIIGYSK